MEQKPMRITCPNCAAQYEVDAAAIPSEGRDVQCSACGHTWLQKPLDGKVPPEQEPVSVPAGAGAGQQGDSEDTPLPEDGDAGEAMPAQPDPPPEARARPPLDDALREILRAEAEREAEARRAEAEAPAEQTYPAPDRPPAGPDTPATAAASEPVQEAEVPRKRLPDIEEVDPVLDAGRPSAPALDEPTATTEEAARRSGFRIGFGVVLGLGGVALALYFYGQGAGAGQAPALDSYVSQVDAARLSLAEGLDRLFAWLTDLMSRGAAS